jgi:hypothetical protein
MKQNKILFIVLLISLGIFASEARAQTPKPGGGGGDGGSGGSVTGGACPGNQVAISNNNQAVPTCVTITSAYIDSSIAKIANNLSDLGNVATARSNLGIANHNLCTVDSSGNFGCPGTLSGGVGSGIAGAAFLPQGTLPTFPANSFTIYVPTSIPVAYQYKFASADPGPGLLYSDGGVTPSNISAKILPTCANDGGHSLVNPSGVITCGTVTGSGGGQPGTTYFTSVLAAGAGPSNTVTQTSVIPTATTGTQTLPVNTFANGTIVNLDIDGRYSTPIATSDTATFTLYAGATAIATSAAIPMATIGVSMTNQHWGANIQIGGSTTGTTGLLVNGKVCFTTSTFAPFCTGMVNTANVAVTFSATQLIDLKVTFSGATSGEAILGTDVKAYIPGASVSSIQTQTGAATLFNNNPRTSTYTATTTDFIYCKTIPVASGTFTLTLVSNTSQPPDGQCIRVLNYGSGIITVAPNGQNLNSSGASMSMAAGSASAPTGLLINSDGTNYTGQPLGASSGGGSGAMTLIQDQVLGSAAATVTFSSIPGTYHHLELIINARCDGSTLADHMYIQANGDTGANYTSQYFAVFNSSATGAGSSSGVAKANVGSINCATTVANTTTGAKFLFIDYANSIFIKSAQETDLGGQATSINVNYPLMELDEWVWNNTAVISSLVIGTVTSYNFVAGSHFSLYGIN